MRLLFVADGRSPTALNWISYFVAQKHEVHLASTYPCEPDLALESLHIVPVAFSKASAGIKGGASGGLKSSLLGYSTVRLRTTIRQWLGPLTLSQAAHRLREVMTIVEPGLVHAMRIPYEGMLAALANPTAPLLISVWGNDFTLHAPANPLMGRYTRLALEKASALHADCQRDIRLAHAWGLSESKPTTVLPGAGGIQTDLFYPAAAPDIRDGGTTLQAAEDFKVINPRGIRAYIRNDTFFRAIPMVLQRFPQVQFLCPAMDNEPQARRWLDELGITNQVQLLPRQTRPQMAELFRQSRVAVSPSTHDGTPNTLLEAMACGCLPVAGDIESVREWITHGQNGLLVDPTSPQDLSEAILMALSRQDLYQRALNLNTRIIAERAAYPRVMASAWNFYQEIVQ